jgi:anthranilate synthase component 1
MEKMNKVKLSTTFRKMAADLYTPVGIYLRLRDKFRDTILLESTDHHMAENSFSFIAINAIGGIEITAANQVEFKYPGDMPTQRTLENTAVPELVWEYMQGYEVETGTKETKFAQGLYGYTAYDAIPFFETIQFRDKPYAVKKGGKLEANLQQDAIPLLRYRLYQYPG